MYIGERKEVLMDIFPTLTKQIQDEGKLEKLREKILRLIELRLTKSSEELKKKIENLESKEKLDLLFDKATLAKDLNEFETEFNKLLKKK